MYIPPCYFFAGHLTTKSDVYSFGVVLVELLTGRKAMDKNRPIKEQILVDWIRPKLNDKKKALEILDKRMDGQYSVRNAHKACNLAYYCLSQNPKARPLMTDIVHTLEPLQQTAMQTSLPTRLNTLSSSDYIVPRREHRSLIANCDSGITSIQPCM